MQGNVLSAVRFHIPVGSVSKLTVGYMLECDVMFSNNKMDARGVRAYAIENGYAHLFEDGATFSDIEVLSAARNGHVQMLQIMRPIGRLGTGVAANAVVGGQLQTLKWLHQRGYTFDKDIHYTAAFSNKIKIARWLDQANGIPRECGVYSCRSSAMRSLPMLKWLRQAWCGECAEACGEKCIFKRELTPWDTSVCRAAAIHGNLCTLKWLRAQDPPCPWDVSTFRLADRDAPGMMEWLKANGCPQ